MPYPYLTNPQILPPGTVHELDSLIAVLNAYLAVQHNADGTHGAITCDSLVASGDIGAQNITAAQNLGVQGGITVHGGIATGGAITTPALTATGAITGGSLASTSTIIATGRITANDAVIAANGVYEHGRGTPMGDWIDVPYAAGGLPDTVARIFARSLQERIGGPVIVENRPGANGNIAAAALMAAPADGYTFVVACSDAGARTALSCCQCENARGNLGRVHSLRQITPGRTQLRFVRGGRAPPDNGGDQPNAALEHDACAVQGRRRIRACLDRRPYRRFTGCLCRTQRRRQGPSNQTARNQWRSALSFGTGPSLCCGVHSWFRPRPEDRHIRTGRYPAVICAQDCDGGDCRNHAAGYGRTAEGRSASSRPTTKRKMWRR